jgi:hypothetical protein
MELVFQTLSSDYRKETSPKHLYAQREILKGWQNARLYYFFCLVAIVATYLTCGGSVANRYNNVSIFDVKNFQYWAVDQSR